MIPFLLDRKIKVEKYKSEFATESRYMGTPKHSAEQIFDKMQQIDTMVKGGLTVAGAANFCGITEQTYYRWRNKFGNLNSIRIAQLRKLKIENCRLRQTVEILRRELLRRKRA
jgi:transposase-like protein